MPVTVRIPTPLRPFTAQQAVVHVEGATVGQVLDRLTSEFVDLKPHLFASDGSLRSFVNVYLNDEDVRYLDRERTAVGAADTVSIVPSVAGGTDAVAAEPPALSHEEVRRYSRHLIMPEIGVEGQ
jgi:adenylyltransferase/sulfurtransferase